MKKKKDNGLFLSEITDLSRIDVTMPPSFSRISTMFVTVYDCYYMYVRWVRFLIVEKFKTLYVNLLGTAIRNE